MSTENKTIKLLKDHHSGKKKGFVGEVEAARAEYLVRTNQAEYVKDETVKKVSSSTAKTKGRSNKNKPQPPCPTC